MYLCTIKNLLTMLKTEESLIYQIYWEKILETEIYSYIFDIFNYVQILQSCIKM